MRGATSTGLSFHKRRTHFYSHAPCGARQPRRTLQSSVVTFLLTRPMRGATDVDVCCLTLLVFLLTRPMRGATSPPALRDSQLQFLLTRPMRGATSPTEHFSSSSGFLLTRPMRGATYSCYGRKVDDAIISTHTPHAGRDEKVYQLVDPDTWDFYSHAPCGARRRLRRYYRLAPGISTHTPHAGRDKLFHAVPRSIFTFLLTRPMRGATIAAFSS